MLIICCLDKGIPELKHLLLLSAPSAGLHKLLVSAINKPPFSSAAIGVLVLQEKILEKLLLEE